MKRQLTRCAVFGAGLMWTSFALAAPPQFAAPAAPLFEYASEYAPVQGTMASYFEEAEKKEGEAPTDAAPAAEEKAAPAADSGRSEPSCEAEEDSCGDEVECGSECASNGDLCSGWSLFNCCPGDPWLLQSALQPCCDKSITYGGWFQVDYYNNNERLSFADNDGLSFRDFPDHVNLDQAWFYVEKLAKAEACSSDWGYRFDVMYGVDAQLTQAYGNPRALDGPNLGAWDASLDNGPYGWAMPQLYAQYASGDWSWKIGKWFTPVGYEVIPATGNFFSSHTLTHFNTEPFSHTGALGTYSGQENMTYYTGWALGWDTGFEQFDGGNIFVGGFTYNVNEDVAFTWMTTVGNLGWRSGGEFGYTQHIVGTVALSENLDYVIQSDFLSSEGTFTDSDFENVEGGVTNYLFYTLNDCWRIGGRIEWWNTNSITGESTSFYDLTAGVNYKPHANWMIRPEVRYDWTPAEDAVEAALGDEYNQVFFGIDAVFTL